MDKKEFSQIVKKERLKSGFTKTGFAKLINCSRVTLWRWENGITMPRKDALPYWLKLISSVANAYNL